MKRLLFAIAGAAAFSAFAADPSGGANDISLVGFENYTADQTVVGYGDSGTYGDNSLWSCQGDDASLVKTYGGDNVAAPSITEPRPFAGETNTRYLALDTNGSELQRAIPAAGQTIAADGTYIDTLVQFTPSESAPIAADLNDAKLAIWLGVENNVTNLCVQGAYYDTKDGGLTLDASSNVVYKLNKSCDPAQWYRLTVKAIATLGNAAATGAGEKFPGFVIMIDGEEIATSTAVYSTAALTGFFAPATEGAGGADDYLDAAELALLKAGKFIPSLDSTRAAATLTAVGFKGTGALDDFVVTTEAPDFTPAGIDFTLTWPAGVTAVSYTIDGGEAVAISAGSPLVIRGVAPDAVVAFTFQNADGATKTMSATASSSVNEIDATGVAFTWADYLGDAVNGAYEIDNLAELKLFQKGVANTNELTTANTTFKLTANITLDAPWPGIGLQNGKDVYSTQQFDDEAFLGIFDGQNYTISGFQMQGGGLDYCGFFNSTYGATIQNLKIAYAGGLFAADTSANSSLESGATFVGVAKNSTLRNLTTVAGTVSCDKGFGGIVGYLTSGTLVDSCTNNVNMTSLKPNKCGGIAMITQGGSAVTICNCQNNGTVAGSGEIGSAIGYIGLDVTISNFESTVAYKMFQHQGSTVTLQGTIKGNATVDSYTGQATPGLNFATVDGSVATFVADGALAAGNAYKVMHTATATYEFAAAGSISFDTNLIQAVTFAITAAQGLKAPTETTANGVVTYTAVALAQPTVTVTGGANAWAVWTVNGSVVSAPATLTEGDTYSVSFTANQGYEFADGATTTFSGTAGTENITIVAPDATAVQQAGWVDDSTAVSNETAAVAYSALAGTALADANAGELTDWAKANNVAFSDVTAAPANYVDAFLLNCAVADVADEKDEFVLTITFDSEGNPVINTPAGKDYNGTLQLKGSNDLSTWTNTDTTEGYQFFKFELSL